MIVGARSAHEDHGYPGSDAGAEDEEEEEVQQAADSGDEFADFEEEEENRGFDEREDGGVDYVEG